MKRRVLLILLLLVAGVIVNIAVAWGFAVRFDPFDKTRVTTQRGWFEMPDSISQGQPVDWWVEKREAIGTTKYFVSVGHSDRSGKKGPLGSTVVDGWARYPQILLDQRSIEKNQMANGWPLRSVICRWQIDSQLGVPPAVRFVGGLGKSELPSNLSHIHALPYMPLWPGFAINTVFYAFILWLLFAVPFALRRRRRIKRGLCPKCAYPVGTNQVCTECGAAVVKPKAETQKADNT